jgi:hypothetical protein
MLILYVTRRKGGHGIRMEGRNREERTKRKEERRRTKKKVRRKEGKRSYIEN